MLNLLKWEWETKIKKALMLWTPVAIVLYIIRQGVQKHYWDPFMLYLSTGEETPYHQALNALIEEKGVAYYFINTTTGRFVVLGMIATITSLVGVSLLVRLVLLIFWEEQEMKGGYLLFTIPESVSKILLVKLLAALPLLIITAVLASLFVLPMFPWWVFFLSLYPFIMFIVFIGVFKKTVLIGKWYKERLDVIMILVIGGAIYFAVPSLVYAFWPEQLDSFLSVLQPTNWTMFLLIAMSTIASTALFFVSVYLLENKLDI